MFDQAAANMRLSQSPSNDTYNLVDITLIERDVEMQLTCLTASPIYSASTVRTDVGMSAQAALSPAIAAYTHLLFGVASPNYQAPHAY